MGLISKARMGPSKAVKHTNKALLTFQFGFRLFSELKTFLVSLTLIFFASGCSIGRSYHPRESMWGLGYSETRLAPDSWRVMYRGYAIPEAQAADYALLRAADLMKSANYPYFAVLSEKSTAPTQAVGMLSMQGGSGFGGMASSTYPETNILIKGFHARPKDELHLVYDTEFIGRELHSKYRVKSPAPATLLPP
jgi:hypothetical protein